MSDKICPDYKAALLSGADPVNVLNTFPDLINCDKEKCGWWDYGGAYCVVHNLNEIGSKLEQLISR